MTAVTELSLSAAVGACTFTEWKADTMLHQFNAHQKRRGLMATTIELRTGHLRRFERWLDPTPLLDATVADVEAYIETRTWEDATQYVFLSHVHAYFKWAVREGLTELDPTEYVDRPRLRPGLPRPISDDQLAYLVAQATGRMRAWLLLGAFAGLRCGEIARLERADVLEADGHLRVLGKGRKERIVPMHPLVLGALHAAPMPKVGALWRMDDGRPVTPHRVSQAINRWTRSMGVDVTAHQLRHYFGTHTYRECQDVLAVGGLLGHANPASTAVYAKFSNKVATAAVLSLDLDRVRRPDP